MTGGAPIGGVLALQGYVREHESVLRGLGTEVVRVRRTEDLARVEGLVLPGGESSVIDKLARIFGLRHPIREAIAAGMPMYGTCAGMILLADDITGAIEGQQTYGGNDITVARNAFGSQVVSLETDLDLPALGGDPVRAAFIRAPLVTRVGAGVEPLATLPDGRVVAVRQGALIATSFHPEVTGDHRFHRLFLDEVSRKRTARV